jgi:hypothetical protein
MTKIQRQKHIAALNTILENAGATEDRWGMYHIGDYKFDTREVNLKIYKDKAKISSKPMVRISIDEFQNYVNKIINN